ncbi:MAG: type VII secretion protein EssC [Thermomicrobiales bacterium]|nr:type VII secretion protein EssC [Thermomicrobiales bacterium]
MEVIDEDTGSDYRMGRPPVFTRTPRDYPSQATGVVELEFPPEIHRTDEASIARVVLGRSIPTLLGTAVVLFATTQSALYAVLAMPVAMAVAAYSYWEEQDKYRTRLERAVTEYQDRLAGWHANLRDLGQAQRTSSLVANPDLAECQRRVQERSTRLWERGPTDADFLHLRIGIGDVPPSFSIKPPQKLRSTGAYPPQLATLAGRADTLVEEFRSIDGCAVLVPLDASIGGTAIVGREPVREASARSAILQLATHHAPTDVKVAVVMSPDQIERWDWVRWLPHVWSEDQSRRYIATTPDETRKLLEEIHTLGARAAGEQAGPGNLARPVPGFVVLIADPQLIQGQAAAWFNPLLKSLVTPDSRSGMAIAQSIVLVESADRVPRECGAIVHLELDEPYLEIVGPPRTAQRFVPDSTSVPDADDFARTLAAVRYLRPKTVAILPDAASLFETLGIERPSDLDLQSAWKRVGSLDHITAPVGLLEDGRGLAFSLGEKGLGHHGLVAGTTGSGKSELLQSIVAALATRYSPEYLSFILVDFKGGAMARPFRDLPHLAGTISNLDKHMTRRVLTTLRAENERRQHVLFQAGVDKIDEYQERYRQGRVETPLPRLVIVVDEFAELRRSEPEFLERFVQIAAVGRSLGVHLILATQKPSGIVTDQIRANTSYYLCLRVQSAEDSKEMLKIPDAALIPYALPGRCYLRVGEAESLRIFQSAFAGARFEPEPQSLAQVSIVALDGTRRKGAEIAIAQQLSSTPSPSQVEALVEHIARFARDAGVAHAPTLWAPPLPEEVSIQRVTGEESVDEAAPQLLAPVIGLLDDPEHFRQPTFAIPFEEKGHVAIFGSPGSGKTIFLQTLVTSLAVGYAVDRVHIYLLEFGGYRLRQLGRFPHVGAVILPDEDERVRRLAQFVVQMVDARSALVADAGSPNLADYRKSHSAAPPDIVIVINNYREFLDRYPDQAEQLTRVAGRSASAGVYFVIANNNALPHRVASAVSTSIALELNDSTEYASLVGRRPHDVLPASGIPGRGLVNTSPVLELQIATPGDLSEGNKLFESLADQIRQKWDTTSLPAPIAVLPEIVIAEDLSEASLRSPRSVTVGMLYETLEPLEISLEDGPHFVVAGPRRSGKTTLLDTLVHSLLENDVEEWNVIQMCLGSASGLCRQQIPLQRLSRIGSNEDLATTLASLGDDRRETAIMIDDFDTFKLHCNDANKSALESLLRSPGGDRVHLIVSGPVSEFASGFDPFVRLLKSSESTFLLGTTDFGDVSAFGAKITSAEAGARLNPGRGFFIRKREKHLFQTAIRRELQQSHAG